MTNTIVNEDDYDRTKELEKFDPKLGVKALVDSGITQIPQIFHHPPETNFDFKDAVSDVGNIIPIIDMAGTHEEVVKKIRNAASTTGFFQIVNHGVEVELLDRLAESIQGFFELPNQEKIQYYNPDSLFLGGVGYYSNYEMLHTDKQPGSWRDTFVVRYGPICSDPADIPPVCRSVATEWGKEAKKLGNRLMSILFEGLGLNPNRFNLESYLKGYDLACQYYPYCPEPDKTNGFPSHTDADPLVILLLNEVGGLQVKYNGQWLDVKPTVHGALIINVGDVMQVVSNGLYKSAEHRVYANPLLKPRVSVTVFFNPSGDNDDLFGPLPDLITPEKPALYKHIKYSDMIEKIKLMELDFETTIDKFRL